MTNQFFFRILFFGLALFAAADVRAQNSTAEFAALLAGISKEYTSTEALLGKMKVEEKQIDARKARLDQEAARLPKEEAALHQMHAKFEAEQRAIDTGIKKTYFDMGCRPNQSTTDIPFAQRCNAMADQVNARQEELNSRVQGGINRVKKMQADRQKLSNDTLKWAEDVKRIRARIADTEQLLAALNARFNGACPLDIRKATIEEIKLKCGNVQFDGARANLPPCPTQRCREFERFVMPSENRRVNPLTPVATPTSKPVPDAVRNTPQWQALDRREQELTAQRTAVQGKIAEIEKNLREGKGNKGEQQVQLVHERQRESNVTSQINVVKVEKESFQLSMERTPAPAAQPSQPVR